MSVLSSLNPQNVFKYFEEICAIPHGSGDMEKIAEYCMNFANFHSLKAVRDDANNVIIYKNASKGYENCAPVILQGHLDMVCQKTAEKEIDFLKDKIEIYTDGDFIKANGTTLGADNGIAVAMILAILSDKTLSHPPIEAVFTTDEEIGMIGASKLDFSLLGAKKMINIDSEEDGCVTVSCAGGSDFKAEFKLETQRIFGTKIKVLFGGLKGGHSGVEINKGRINADILAGRFLNHMRNLAEFHIIRIDGGDKGNAIPNNCIMEIVSSEPEKFKAIAEDYTETLKNEIFARENDFNTEITVYKEDNYTVFTDSLKNSLISILTSVPNSVMEMSAEIDSLVETSLNLGILKTDESGVTLHFALRSNKQSALSALEEKLLAFFSLTECKTEASGHYPPWEFKSDSLLRSIYIDSYKELSGKEPKVEAIHAGLECSVFSANIPELDCIAIGPDLFDVHTVNERLSISSTNRTFNLILKILSEIR